MFDSTMYTPTSSVSQQEIILSNLAMLRTSLHKDRTHKETYFSMARRSSWSPAVLHNAQVRRCRTHTTSPTVNLELD